MTTTPELDSDRAWLDEMKAERLEREARRKQDRATLDAAAQGALGAPLEDLDFGEVRAMAQEMSLDTPAEEIICPVCQGSTDADSLGSANVRRGDERRHACRLPQLMRVAGRDRESGQAAPHEVFHVPDGLLDEDAYWTDDLALALHGRLTMECTRDQQEHLRELWENGQVARAEREDQVEWAKDPGLECGCREVVAAQRQDGTPDLSALNITHTVGCHATAVPAA